MKILYALQGTGNGHVARAREIIPFLTEHETVDVLVSGTQVELGLEHDVKFRLKGFGFVFGKSGGIDFLETWRRFDSLQFLRDIRNLPVRNYDLIINDFEPVAAWACRLHHKESVALSHQSAFHSPKTPKIKGFHWGRWIMNNYAPTTQRISFHFRAYDEDITTPVIRAEIRSLKPQNSGHYTVYLPAYADEFILKQVSGIPGSRWEIFSKHTKHSYAKDNAAVYPIDNLLFQRSLANCRGLLTGGGFEGPAEALFLGKKLLCVPMKHQYEQQCNALALEEMGVPIIWNVSEFEGKLRAWTENHSTVSVDFPDGTATIIEKIINKFAVK
jgi:uncharacterized protein (TIGR00661 family)